MSQYMVAKELGVVIPVWNRPKMLGNLLDNLTKIGVSEIVVVDDGSIESHAWAQEKLCNKYGAQYLFLEMVIENDAKVRNDMLARQIGCCNLTSPLCLFMDSDMLLPELPDLDIGEFQLPFVLFLDCLCCSEISPIYYGCLDVKFHRPHGKLSSRLYRAEDVLRQQISSIHCTQDIQTYLWDNQVKIWGEVDCALGWFHEGKYLYALDIPIYHYGGMNLCPATCECLRYPGIYNDVKVQASYLTKKWDYPQLHQMLGPYL